jgi:V8-like Glu-specific endopeptidase
MLMVLGQVGQTVVTAAAAAAFDGSARTTKLLAGAAGSLAIAFAPLVIDRVTRRHKPATRTLGGTDIPYTPPRRRRPAMWRLTVGGLVLAAVFVAAIWLPPTKHPPLPALPPANAISPGIGIGVNYTAGNANAIGCTAGFLVRTSAGRNAILTAGHCNKAGSASQVVMNYSTAHAEVAVGTFQQMVDEGGHGEDHDIGLVVLDGQQVGQTSAITGNLPVAAVTSELREKEWLCKFGMATGQSTCGPIEYVTASKVVFKAATRCGDSGGPVYVVRPDHSAAAVGILIRGGDPSAAESDCSGSFAMAELVKPWLDQWQLTAVTAAPGPPTA